MTLSKQDELLLEEYKITLEMIRHEDSRKANLFSILFIIQGGFFGFYSWIVVSYRSTAIILAVFATIFSVLWFFVMERMRSFIWLKYAQAQSIEKSLGTLTTITNEEMLRKNGKVEIMGIPYQLSSLQKMSVSKTESLLPILIAVFWILIALGGALNIL